MSIGSELKQRIGRAKNISSRTLPKFETFMTLPSLLYVLLIAGFPILYLIYASFTQQIFSPIEPTEFVGIENYVRILTNPTFYEYLGNTIFFSMISVFGGLILQLGIALIINTTLPFQRVWQTLILLPWAVPHVISAQLWRLLFNPAFGAINWILLETGIIGNAINWFSGKWVAFGTIIVTDIWVRTPLVVVILLAGLQTIPDDLYEAARIDGAGIWNRFIHVTLPQLRSALIVVLVIRMILALRAFELIYALTVGGPGDATTVVGLDIWRQLIVVGDIGYAAAEAVILVTIVYLLIGIAVYAFPSAEAQEVA